MLLTLTTTEAPATDLGYLLHKHPDRFQTFDLSFGAAHVFYPDATADRCTACLMLQVDPIRLVRGTGSRHAQGLGQYVNDRPFVASSYLSVAIAQVFRTAMTGQCRDRPDRAAAPLDLSATLDMLPVRGAPEMISRIFEPLGYTVEAVPCPLDPLFPEWGGSSYYSVTLRQTIRLADLLAHLYVLIPAFDNDKHYAVGDDELEKLLAKGAGWLWTHPEKEWIARRYLRHRQLSERALERLVTDEELAELEASAVVSGVEEGLEREANLHEQRHGAVLSVLRSHGARRVVDLGCGDGRLLRRLFQDRQFTQVAGLDVSSRALEIAARRLHLDRLSEAHQSRVRLWQGALTYRDDRLANFDAAVLVEVIEHLDPARLAAFERVVFEFARPALVIVTTPNREYNRMWETLPSGQFRHADHRFEWTRDEFRAWAQRVAAQTGYRVRFVPIGPADAEAGSPTQMGVFEHERSGAPESPADLFRGNPGGGVAGCGGGERTSAASDRSGGRGDPIPR